MHLTTETDRPDILYIRELRGYERKYRMMKPGRTGELPRQDKEKIFRTGTGRFFY